MSVRHKTENKSLSHKRLFLLLVISTRIRQAHRRPLSNQSHLSSKFEFAVSSSLPIGKQVILTFSVGIVSRTQRIIRHWNSICPSRYKFLVPRNSLEVTNCIIHHSSLTHQQALAICNSQPVCRQAG